MNTISEFKGKYSFLSNFARFTVRHDSNAWRTSEHAYQAAKTRIPKQQREIQLASTPGKAKQLGRRTTIRYNWDKIKTSVMLEIIRAKFKQNNHLSKKLLWTGDKTLIEGNYWHDNFWGDCYCPKCKEINGVNALGKILMQVRIEIQYQITEDLPTDINLDNLV